MHWDIDAMLLLPVTFKYLQYSYGFDGYANPHWLMVPENGSNSCFAYTPASSTFTATFSVESTGVGTTVFPATTNTSPQTITVNAGYLVLLCYRNFLRLLGDLDKI
jgi:hypothetical protein